MPEEKYPDGFEDLRQSFLTLCEESELMDDCSGTTNEKQNVEIRNMLDELNESIQKVEAKEESLLELLKQLNIYCEKIQIVQLSSDDLSFSKPLMIFLKNLFKIKIYGKDTKHAVRHFGHILHQLKLIQHPKTETYDRVIVMLDKSWDKFVKKSFNDDRRYLHKITGLVHHLDATRYWVQGDADKAYRHSKSSQTFYEKAKTWQDESIKCSLKKMLDDTLEKISDVRREHECKEETIGKEGGRLITNHCEIEIPKDAIDKSINFTIETDAEMILLPDENIQISPTLTCMPNTILYEEATIKLPTYCTTEDEDVEANVFTKENDEEGWKIIYSGSLKKVKKDFSFTTKSLRKWVISIQKKFYPKTSFTLDTEVWYSREGNVIGVVYTNNKEIKELWKHDLQSRGYLSSQAVLNTIPVKGSDQLEFKISCQSSNVIRFDKVKSNPFTAKKHLAKNEHKHYANFRLRVLPVGDERLTFSCSLSCNGEEMEQVEWNEIWTSRTDLTLEDLFKDEIVPTFKNLPLHVWETFATSPSGLGLTDREINRNIDLMNTSTKELRLKALMLWKQKSSGMGKRGGDENDNILKDIIRRKTITCRENNRS